MRLVHAHMVIASAPHHLWCGAACGVGKKDVVSPNGTNTMQPRELNGFTIIVYHRAPYVLIKPVRALNSQREGKMWLS